MSGLGQGQQGSLAGSGSASLQIRQFWILAVFLCLVFVTGGSSWPSEPHLLVLRPVAILLTGYALVTLQADDWRHYRAIWILGGAALVLTLIHLVPLPPGIWRSLPGRDIVASIDDVAALDQVWRPLTMAPDDTINALYSMSVPFAVALLAAQLDSPMHRRLLVVVISLSLLSGAIALAQAAGMDWRSYQNATRLGGLFINRNQQGLLLAMVIPVSAAWAAVRSQPSHPLWMARIIPVAVAIIIIPLIILSGSRMGLIMSGLALVTLPLFWPEWSRTVQGDLRRNVLIAMGWIVPVLAIGGAWYSLSTARGMALDRLQGTDDGLRATIWSSTVDMIGSYLPWGSGIGTYAKVYQVLEPPEVLQPKYMNHAHNEWLEIALTAGIPGLLILAGAAILLAIAAWRSVRGTNVPTSYNRLGVLAIFMLAIASTPDYPVRTPILSAMLALAAVWATPGRTVDNAARAA